MIPCRYPYAGRGNGDFIGWFTDARGSRKQRRMCERKKNQGFSLVEMIVAVAIMVVMVGLLVPSYLGYIEKTRAGIDEKAADDIRSATETLVLSGTYEVTEEVLVTFSSAGIQVSDVPYAAALEEELKNIFPDFTEVVPVSKKYKDSTYKVELTESVNTTLMIEGHWE